ncbi:unnamed protein product [Leuciscus chuanchicus]
MSATANFSLELESMSEDPQPRRGAVKSAWRKPKRRTTEATDPSTTEKLAKVKNIFRRELKTVKHSIQNLKTKVDEQESQVHPGTSSVDDTYALESEPTDGPSEMGQMLNTIPVYHETMMCLPGQVCEDLCVPGPSRIEETQHVDPVDPEPEPVPELSSFDLDDKKLAKKKNIFKRGLKTVKHSVQTLKTKVCPLVAEQESQVHPDTSSVEPPADTYALESEPTDGPSKMGQMLDTYPVYHETMMCLPGQVCEDLCVPGPSRIEETQHAYPVDPEPEPVPELSSFDLDDKKLAKKKNIFKRGLKTVKHSVQTLKTKVRPLVAEQESQVHPDTSSVEPPADTYALESEPTDGPSEMGQMLDTYPVYHETMMCLPGQVCEDLCVPGPSRIEETQHAYPVDPEPEPVPELSSFDLDDKKLAKVKNIFKRGLKTVKHSIQTLKTKVRPLVAEQESQVHPDTSSVEPPADTYALESEPTDGPSKMGQMLNTIPVYHETMMCLPGQVCEDLCVPGPSRIEETQHAYPVDPEPEPVPELSSFDLDDKKLAKVKNIFRRELKTVKHSIQTLKNKVCPKPTDEKLAKVKNIFRRELKTVKHSIQTLKDKVCPLVAEQESQVHPGTSRVEPKPTDALEGGDCVHCEALPLRTLRSRLARFNPDHVPQGLGPAAAEARRRSQTWGSQMDLSVDVERGSALSQHPSDRSSASHQGAEARAAVSSPPMEAPILQLSSSEELDVVSIEAGSEDSPPQSHAFEELLDVVTRAVQRLSIEWPEDRQDVRSKSKLDERFLPSRAQPQRRSLPFFPDLHTEVSRSWGKPVSYRVYTPQTSHYSSIHKYKEYGYGEMPKVEEMLASYLSPATASSLKAPSLPSKPVKFTSSLVHKSYAAAGQAAACLHTMSIMQAYQAELLGDLEEGGGIGPDTVAELRRATDLSLRATKETAKSIGRSMAALVATERHLWLNLSDIKEKEKHVLLDAPVSTVGLFGDAVNSAVAKSQEAAKQAAALQKLLPRRSFIEAAEREQPHSSKKSAEHRATQKQSVSSRAPPQKSRGHGGRSQTQQSSRGKTDLRTGTVLPTLPPLVLQGAAVSGEHISQGPSGNVVASGCPPPPRRVLEQSVRSFPAGAPLQGVEPTTQQQQNPETSLERLVPLVESLTAWKLLSNVSRWVLQTVEKGYQIQFKKRPPRFMGVLPTVVGPEQVLVMEQEVNTLLEKGAIEYVPPSNRETGFYSRYFIVPKKDGGLRPILDLRVLNESVMQLKFKMLTLRQIVPQIRSEDWFVTIDLKDAYFHISIRPCHWKFLRFAFGGKAYQYRVLPFGLALSPRTFTKCVDAALAPLRLQGIRIMNYIDDWLILAQSHRLAVQHRDVVLAHMKELGLRLNAKKSVLSPLQRTTFLGVVWDSVSMQARLSPPRIDSILAAVKSVKLGQLLTVKQFQRLLGLMAAASNVIPFGLLHMRPLQWWLRTRGFSPRGNPFRTIKVTRRCLRALVMWKKPWFLSQGPVLGAPCRRKLLTTDASLTGWGAILEGRSSQGLWEDHHRSWHINRLEMLAVFRALRSFITDLRGHHVLVHTDNTSVVAYINHQGGLRSRPLSNLARHILLWSQGKLLSLRAAYIPGVQNIGADTLSRQGPRPGEWRLHPEVVELIWREFGHAQVDLFASRETSHCPLWFSLTHPAPLGLDAMGPGPSTSYSPALAGQSMVSRSCVPPRRASSGASRQEGPFVPGRGLNISPPPRTVEPVGLASEGAQLIESGLSTEVVETILQSRAPSTRKLYALKWRVFTSWCSDRRLDPVNCPIGTVLEFLQDRFTAGLTPSTLKVYVAAIGAYHIPLGGMSVGKDPLVSRFLRGTWRLRPAVHSRVPPWDLSVALQGLSLAPFEPIEEVPEKFLTLKALFLLAISSLKRIGDLQALSVAPSCLEFAPGMVKAFLHPRPGYIPKVPTNVARPIVLQAFCPPPFQNADQEANNLLCPVRALDAYVHRAALWRKSDQLFVCFGSPNKGGPVSKQRMSKWVVEAISLAYEAAGQPSPLAVRSHSTRSMAASKALISGVSLQDVWDAAGWSSPHTFVRFYSLDLDSAPGSHVLSS